MVIIILFSGDHKKKKKNKNNESPFFWIGLVFLDANLAATVLDSGDHSFLMKQKRDICSCFCFASFFFLGFFDLHQQIPRPTMDIDEC